jgi:lysine 2,3-aminomutase
MTPRIWENVEEKDWENWRWQLRHRILTVEQLRQVINPIRDEELAVRRSNGRLPMSITPYFASLMDMDDRSCPIRRQAVPLTDEFRMSPFDMRDPCCEDRDSPAPGLVHRYPDRVLLLVTDQCAVYCRHCTRRRKKDPQERPVCHKDLGPAMDYIRANRKVRDVLISGGDPLLLSNDDLKAIIGEVKSIPHVELVRIGTRVPVTLPQRITDDLVAMLREYSPLWMSIHFNHPKEITPRCKKACDMLAEAGIPLGSQTVLLKGINDDISVMRKLMHELLKIRVRPYYIYQCDPARGTSHFRTSVARGIEIIENLRGHTSGYAVPTYVVDAPGGGGKVPVAPDYVLSYADGVLKLRNYAGKIYLYREEPEVAGATYAEATDTDARAEEVPQDAVTGKNP